MNSVQVSSSSFCMYFDANYTNLVKSKSKNKNGLKTITKRIISDEEFIWILQSSLIW